MKKKKNQTNEQKMIMKNIDLDKGASRQVQGFDAWEPKQRDQIPELAREAFNIMN